jgi:hypothetical protein
MQSNTATKAAEILYGCGWYGDVTFEGDKCRSRIFPSIPSLWEGMKRLEFQAQAHLNSAAEAMVKDGKPRDGFWVSRDVETALSLSRAARVLSRITDKAVVRKGGVL